MINNKKRFIPVCEPLLEGNELKYITEAVKSGWISSSGKYVDKFEKLFSNYCNSEYGIAVTNGTVAIHLALKALNIGTGDEVIIPNFTMIATAFAVCYTGAKPIFVDSEINTWNIDANKIESKISKNTKAIIPVHIFGLPCDMDPIRKIAKKYDLFVIEDAAEAHGAIYGNEKVGEMSDISTFSFFANKNLTTGEGGMLVTNDEKLYKNANYLKNMAFPLDSARVYTHDSIGFNYRMSNLHAAIGLAQTEKADYYKTKRIKNGKIYRKLLANVNGITFQKDISPISKKNVENVYWMNAIIIDKNEFGHSKDELIEFLRNKGVDTRLLFTGMNKQKSLIDFGCDQVDEKFPVSDLLETNGLYLPSSSLLNEDSINFICDTIKSMSL